MHYCGIIDVMKIFISAGEVSGDLHAAFLVRALKRRMPEAQFFGMGGAYMKQEGVDLVCDLTPYSTVGFIEPLQYLGKFFGAYRHIINKIKMIAPDVVIAVDFQGFNMPLLKRVKRLGIPTVYYIAPQEWHWGTASAGRRVIAAADLIIAIYKEEAAFYRELNGRVTYVGSPVVDEVQSTINRETFYAQLQIPTDKKIVAVFLGSRKQEIDMIGPILLLAAQMLAKRSDIQLVFSVGSEHYRSRVMNLAEKMGVKDFKCYSGKSWDLIAHAYFSLTVSGTITLEHAVLNTPFITLYRVSAVSYCIGRLILGERFYRIKYIAMPNMLLDEPCFPEFVQDDATPDHLVAMANRFLDDPELYQNQKDGLKRVQAILGEPGVIDRAAEAIYASVTP